MDDYLFFDSPSDPNKPLGLAGFTVQQGDQSRPVNRGIPVRAVNVLIGPNNAGKSRLLRELFQREVYRVTDADAERFEFVARSARSLIGHSNEHIARIGSQFEAAAVRPIQAFDYEQRNAVPGIFVKWSGSELVLSVSDHMLREPSFAAAIGSLIPAGVEGKSEGGWQTISICSHEKAWLARNYVPPFRSTLRIADVSPASSEGLWREDPLGFTFSHTYGLPSVHTSLSTDHGLFTGQRLYEEAFNALNGTRRSKDRWVEQCGRVLFDLFGLRNGEIRATNISASRPDGSASPIKQLMVESPDLPSGAVPVQEMGDGVSACLTIVMPLLMANDNKAVLFVEEPEIGLHPGLLRRLARLLCDPQFLGKTTLFLSTHSPVLLDALGQSVEPSQLSLLQVSDKSSNKGHNHVIRPVQGDSIAHLESLGATSQALLARTLVWVEGPSDVRYLSGMLALECPDLVEGRDFALIPFGGSLLDRFFLDESATTVSQTIKRCAYYSLVLSDLDSGKEFLHKRRRAAVDAFSARIRYLVTPGIELENSLGEAFWREALPQIHRHKWSQFVRPFPPDYRSVRMRTIANYVCGQVDEIEGDGETLSSSEKMDAAELFLRQARSRRIELEPDAKSLARQIGEFIRNPDSSLSA